MEFEFNCRAKSLCRMLCNLAHALFDQIERLHREGAHRANHARRIRNDICTAT